MKLFLISLFVLYICDFINGHECEFDDRKYTNINTQIVVEPRFNTRLTYVKDKERIYKKELLHFITDNNYYAPSNSIQTFHNIIWSEPYLINYYINYDHTDQSFRYKFTGTSLLLSQHSVRKDNSFEIDDGTVIIKRDHTYLIYVNFDGENPVNTTKELSHDTFGIHLNENILISCNVQTTYVNDHNWYGHQLRYMKCKSSIIVKLKKNDMIYVGVYFPYVKYHNYGIYTNSDDIRVIKKIPGENNYWGIAEY